MKPNIEKLTFIIASKDNYYELEDYIREQP